MKKKDILLKLMRSKIHNSRASLNNATIEGVPFSEFLTKKSDMKVVAEFLAVLTLKE